MAQELIYEGTPTQLVQQLMTLPEAQKYRMTITREEQAEEEIDSLNAAISRMLSRTPEETSAIRERLLAATPPPREIPEGQTIFDMVMGKWPGDETDEQIIDALEKLS